MAFGCRAARGGKRRTTSPSLTPPSLPWWLCRCRCRCRQDARHAGEGASLRCAEVSHAGCWGFRIWFWLWWWCGAERQGVYNFPHRHVWTPRHRRRGRRRLQVTSYQTINYQAPSLSPSPSLPPSLSSSHASPPLICGGDADVALAVAVAVICCRCCWCC